MKRHFDSKQAKYFLLYQWESHEKLIFVWTSFRIFRILTEVINLLLISFGFSSIQFNILFEWKNFWLRHHLW